MLFVLSFIAWRWLAVDWFDRAVIIGCLLLGVL